MAGQMLREDAGKLVVWVGTISFAIGFAFGAMAYSLLSS